MRAFDIFLSYAHEDEDLMHRVRQQLVIYDRQKKIVKWWDRKITPGASLHHEINEHLQQADIILLFISPSFFDSDYCYDVEMQQALRQHEEQRSVVIPVIVRPCEWASSPLGSLLALPTDGRPLPKWPNRDEGAKNVADGVMRAVAELHKQQATP